MCLTDPMAFYDGVAASLDKGIAMDIIPLDFCETFDSVPHNVLLINWRDMGLMDGPLVDKELSEWQCPKCYSQ